MGITVLIYGVLHSVVYTISLYKKWRMGRNEKFKFCKLSHQSLHKVAWLSDCWFWVWEIVRRRKRCEGRGLQMLFDDPTTTLFQHYKHETFKIQNLLSTTFGTNGQSVPLTALRYFVPRLCTSLSAHYWVNIILCDEIKINSLLLFLFSWGPPRWLPGGAVIYHGFLTFCCTADSFLYWWWCCEPPEPPHLYADLKIK